MCRITKIFFSPFLFFISVLKHGKFIRTHSIIITNTRSGFYSTTTNSHEDNSEKIISPNFIFISCFMCVSLCNMVNVKFIKLVTAQKWYALTTRHSILNFCGKIYDFSGVQGSVIRVNTIFHLVYFSLYSQLDPD